MITVNTDVVKDLFMSAARDHINRDGLADLLNWLENTDFFDAPASTRFHGAEPGGLAAHSVNVWTHLRKLNSCYEAGLSEESMAVAALFHDLCKVNYYKQTTRNVKNEVTGQWEKVPYYAREEEFPFGGHGSKSMFLVMSFMKLTPDEAAAINCHMGSWDHSSYGNPGDVFEDSMLAWLLHVADEAATYINKT